MTDQEIDTTLILSTTTQTDMKITKRTIDKAINFLETIPEERFCSLAYTSGERHCSGGWLFLGANAPFVYLEMCDISTACHDCFMIHLTGINDASPEGQIKATVINALCLLKRTYE